MPHYEWEEVTVTTDGAGAGSGATNVCTGSVAGIVYTKAASNGLETATILVTGTDSGVIIWSQSNVDASTDVYPLAAAHKAATGGAFTDIGVPVPIANETINVSVSSGGATKTGTFRIIINGSYRS